MREVLWEILVIVGGRREVKVVVVALLIAVAVSLVAVAALALLVVALALVAVASVEVGETVIDQERFEICSEVGGASLFRNTLLRFS